MTHLHPAQSFDKVELLQCIRRLVEVDKDWVPDSSGTSLYVRPVLIGNEVGWLPGLGVGWGGEPRLGEGWGPRHGSGERPGAWTPGSLMPASTHLSPR